MTRGLPRPGHKILSATESSAPRPLGSESVHYSRVQGHTAECKISRETQVFKLHHPTPHISILPTPLPQKARSGWAFYEAATKVQFQRDHSSTVSRG